MNEPFDPDFEIIKMDAEIGSYQEDFGSDDDAERVQPEVERDARD